MFAPDQYMDWVDEEEEIETLPQQNPEWWPQTKSAAQFFFELIEKPSLTRSPRKLQQFANKLEWERTMLDAIVFPQEAERTRFYLMAALTDLITGLTRALSGDPRMASAYFKAAQVEHGFLKAELVILNLM